MPDPQRLNGVIGDVREGEDTTIRGSVILLVIGLLFFVQSVIIASIIFLQKSPGQSLDSLLGSVFGCLGCWLWAWYLSIANHRKRWLKVVLIILGIAFICAILPTKVHEWRVEEHARKWLSQAQEAAKPTWTEDDAIHWFTDRNIKPHRSVGEGENVIDGYQQIEEGGNIFQPASVHISFIFAEDHKFERVDYKVWPFDPPDRR
jgi:hypothetical protein